MELAQQALEKQKEIFNEISKDLQKSMQESAEKAKERIHKIKDVCTKYFKNYDNILVQM